MQMKLKIFWEGWSTFNANELSTVKPLHVTNPEHWTVPTKAVLFPTLQVSLGLFHLSQTTSQLFSISLHVFIPAAASTSQNIEVKQS